jgi:NADP-dependent 3-hydroxy acid dehydrogenase YdfG
MKLADKVVLITGGGSGSGAATAEVCCREGARVVIAGRNEDKLKKVAEAIDGEVAVFAADVSDRSRVNELVEWASAECGQIDIVVNSSGVNIVDRTLEKLSPENWDYTMNVNVTGAFNVIHAVLPQMRSRGDGVIISISSLAGDHPSVLAGTAYSASKHAMSTLTRMIDLEEAENGIRATVISPGEINTPILDERPVKVSDEHRQRILQPIDIAEAVLFVAAQPPHVCISEMTIKPRGMGQVSWER